MYIGVAEMQFRVPNSCLCLSPMIHSHMGMLPKEAAKCRGLFSQPPPFMDRTSNAFSLLSLISLTSCSTISSFLLATAICNAVFPDLPSLILWALGSCSYIFTTSSQLLVMPLINSLVILSTSFASLVEAIVPPLTTINSLATPLYIYINIQTYETSADYFGNIILAAASGSQQYYFGRRTWITAILFWPQQADHGMPHAKAAPIAACDISPNCCLWHQLMLALLNKAFVSFENPPCDCFLKERHKHK